jgi:adenine nucleotide transporter 17
MEFANKKTGIGPKVTQSVLTAAFLFAFKDMLYEHIIKLRTGGLRKRGA